MKKLQKVLLGTAIAGTLVAGAGIGTYSWFNAEKEAVGAIDNGTFFLGEMGQLFQHEKFAPSQILFSDFNTVENTGNMNQLLRATYTHKVNSENVSVNKYKVGWFAMKMKEKPSGDEVKAIQERLGAIVNGNAVATNSAKIGKATYEVDQGVYTENEAQTLAKQGKVTSKTLTLGDGTKFWRLKEDEHILIMFAVKLSENAGNQYQGVKYDASFKVEAKQTDAGAMYQSDMNVPK
ncbi:hypothetical protein ABES02_22080 [Neobacillus pocheonensis]|uniref:hypothetical protein n=1 Tax=Neobacillus pocheonensis TaxID=363869 RepID=UPI003D2720B3